MIVGDECINIPVLLKLVLELKSKELGLPMREGLDRASVTASKPEKQTKYLCSTLKPITIPKVSDNLLIALDRNSSLLRFNVIKLNNPFGPA